MIYYISLKCVVASLHAVRSEMLLLRYKYLLNILTMLLLYFYSPVTRTKGGNCKQFKICVLWFVPGSQDHHRSCWFQSLFTEQYCKLLDNWQLHESWLTVEISIAQRARVFSMKLQSHNCFILKLPRDKGARYNMIQNQTPDCTQWVVVAHPIFYFFPRATPHWKKHDELVKSPVHFISIIYNKYILLLLGKSYH